jgi:hypothetical protein
MLDRKRGNGAFPEVAWVVEAEQEGEMAMFGMFAQRIVGAIALLASASASAGDGVHLALSGLHLAADPVRGGGDWWGIFPEGEGYTFQPVRVRVEAVIDPLADGDTRKTATQITAPGNLQELPLIRGLMSAVAGPLKSLKPAKNWKFIAPGDTIKLPLGRDDVDDQMRIVASGNGVVKKSGPSDVTVISGYQLRLVQGSGGEQHAQLLVALPEFFRFADDYGPELLWAGDLDRDGRLDLLYNLSSFYMYTHLALFLSSAAKDGELVGLVARWNAVGGC